MPSKMQGGRFNRLLLALWKLLNLTALPWKRSPYSGTIEGAATKGGSWPLTSRNRAPAPRPKPGSVGKPGCKRRRWADAPISGRRAAGCPPSKRTCAVPALATRCMASCHVKLLTACFSGLQLNKGDARPVALAWRRYTAGHAQSGRPAGAAPPRRRAPNSSRRGTARALAVELRVLVQALAEQVGNWP